MKQILPQAAALTTDANGFAQGRVPTSADTATRLPDFGARALPFRLSHHPSSWELVETSKGWRLIPVLSRLNLKPGVNWSKGRKGRVADSSDIAAKAQSRWDQVVLTDWAQYTRLYDGAKGRTGHFLAWEKLKIYSDGGWEVQTDKDAYALWRWALVTSGTLAPPRNRIISETRTRLQKRMRRATRTPHLLQAQEARAEAERRLKGLEEAIEALEDIGATQQPRRVAAVSIGSPEADAEIAALRAELARMREQLGLQEENDDG